MKNTNTFQIILLAVFGVAIVLSVLAFSGFLPGLDSTDQKVSGKVEIWGTFPISSIQPVIYAIKEKYDYSIEIVYKEKIAEQFDKELVEALASGTGPDLIIIPDTLLVRHSNKITQVPFTVTPLRTYRDTFADGVDIFLTPTGILAYPLVADPLVLYFNKDALARAGFADTPRYWTQLIDESASASPLARMTRIDERGNILESAIGLGDFGNVDNAKDIVSLLILQAGNPIISRNEEGALSVELTNKEGQAQAGAALNFFTQFSNPTKTTYTWNSSLPNSSMLFSTGKLALYLGLASEHRVIKAQNAHLNFDVAEVPQRDASKKITIGRLYGIALMKQSKNPQAAGFIQQAFTDQTSSKAFSDATELPPLRRDLLSTVPTDPALVVFTKSTIVTRSWPDPNPEATNNIFGTMVQSLLSGQGNTNQALIRASNELSALLPK